MTWELIHTSAPRGVLVAHGGFVTVMATAGIPRSLVDVLEALSALDPRRAESGAGADAVPDERDALHAHRIVSIGGARGLGGGREGGLRGGPGGGRGGGHGGGMNGRLFSVLTRIVPWSVDHTGRPNRLAHHIVLEPRERPAAGPAAVLSDFPGFLDEWKDPPLERPFGPRVDAAPRSPAQCTTWHERFGDAGWAGEVLRLVFERSSTPLHVLLPTAMDIRPLMDEMVALLPEARRWSVTFTSRAVGTRPDVQASLRLVSATDRDVASLRRRPGARLLEPSGRAPESPWCDAARRGIVIERMEWTGSGDDGSAEVELQQDGRSSQGSSQGAARQIVVPPRVAAAPDDVDASSEGSSEIGSDAPGEPTELVAEWAPPATATRRGAPHRPHRFGRFGRVTVFGIAALALVSLLSLMLVRLLSEAGTAP